MPISLGTTTITALFLGTTSISSAYLGSTQVFGGSFTPLSLFSGGAQGVWYDPSDLTTMFSDRAGTTAVTAPGQLVGLRLDKSKGLALGAELVTNGTFDSGIANWTSGLNSPVLSWVPAGAMRVSRGSAAGFSVTTQSVTGLVVGKTYVATAEFSAITSGLVPSIAVNGVVSGTNRAVFRATATTHTLELVTSIGSTGQSFDVDNISLRELAGNHATAPTDAARPMYGVEPKGGRRNLLLATDTLATQSLTVTAVAHTLAFTGTGTVTLTGASTAGPLVGTGAGDRVSLTFTPTAASLTLTVSGSVTLGQLELGSSATAYQKVVTAYNVTESGVATCHYVQFDGSDDSMSTAAIDFTATDKMSVFAGVRKLSDAADACLVELSASAGSNNGSFHVFTGPNPSAPNRYSSFTKGSAGFSIGNWATTNIGNAPDAAVLATTHDIAGDLTTIRRNGVAGTSATVDLGSGNFATYPLFIGRRNNSVAAFNGKDYGILVVGKAVTPTEITDTETWLAARTSGVTI